MKSSCLANLPAPNRVSRSMDIHNTRYKIYTIFLIFSAFMENNQYAININKYVKYLWIRDTLL